ncbi:MAG: hypothetical protein CV088_21740 [Nitrospira sp. LK70]|nr:hypothetical protein [Nitrospira sp. LK70]
MIVGTLLGLICIVAMLYFALVQVPRKRRLGRFLERETLTESQIYHSYFADSHLPASLIEELWNEVADFGEIPRGLLRPTDRFDTELASLRGWEFGGEISSLNIVAERRARNLGPDFDLAQIHTVRDYIEKFGALAQRQGKIDGVSA